MQLKRYNLFKNLLKDESDFISMIESFEVYRKSENEWFDSTDSKVTGDNIIKNLDLTLQKGVHWRGSKGVFAHFPLPQFKAVVVTKSVSPTKKATRDKIQKILLETANAANIQFKAAFDASTGLLNSRSLEETIMNLIGSAPSSDEPANAEIQSARSIGLMSLDIDYFKQVNDSYGHDYGDVVIKCFAHRLEEAVDAVQRDYGSTIKLDLGRSGGEEFCVVLSGALTIVQLKEIAERLRTSISNTELPTEAEWLRFGNPNGRFPVSLPHVTERRITTSIGISALKKPSVENALGIFSDLRKESDAALYRAKSGGRDTFRYFTEIRDRFGAVIEHHKETNIVTIDIGSQVNVKKGQEFHVYHPDFTGAKAFIFTDGRSKKRLGNYPRYSSGRIVVFDVQAEISFCTVAEKSLDHFPAGSLLEQIPLGSIYHLVSPDIKASFNGTVHPDELDKYIQSIVKKNERPIAIVFSLIDLPLVEKERGTAFVNRALAGLFEEILTSFPSPAKICQLDSDKIAVAAQISQKADCAAMVAKIVEAAAKKAANFVNFSAGVFSTNMMLDHFSGDQSKYDPNHALSYARYAAVSIIGTDKRIEFFTAETAARIMIQHRSRATFQDALVDAQLLRDLGVQYASFENLVGWCAFALAKYDVALVCAKQAVALSPSDPVFKANLAYALFRNNQLSQAHDTFSQLRIKHPKFNLFNSYLGVEALAAYSVFKEQPTKVQQATLISLLQNALNKESFSKKFGRQSLEDALKDVSSYQPPPDNFDIDSTLNLNETWARLVEAVGKVSAFTRSYLLNAHPVSFVSGIFTIGYPSEFHDFLALVDNQRNQRLLISKLQEIGCDANVVKFIKHEEVS